MGLEEEAVCKKAYPVVRKESGGIQKGGAVLRWVRWGPVGWGPAGWHGVGLGRIRVCG